ncbi:golgin subfamily A member 5-like [Gossypium australe]|uniref:Golgin subfamily A member 5-like n=1 Tax=Gossypium australe TaxID=47621 RepID=A0A5B6WM98_9ROSI|nr:golgin subfamily A member 5-like [Gossypium australe]
MIPDEILYRYGDFNWFIPATQGLAQSEFAYKCDNYKKKVRGISNAWNQTHRIKRFVASPMTTPEYDWWWGKIVNDNFPVSSQENTRPIEEQLQVILSGLEILK